MSDNKKFPLLSGNLSLDLVNTEIVRRGKKQELLQTTNDLMDWIYAINEQKAFPFYDEILSLQEKHREQVLAAILHLRIVLRDNFEKIADGEPINQAFISFLEEKIKNAPITYRMTNGRLLAKPIGAVKDKIESLIALDVLMLIESTKLKLIKRCENPDCVLLFLDETGRRKWCSMQICGNRKKAKRFQQRKGNENE